MFDWLLPVSSSSLNCFVKLEFTFTITATDYITASSSIKEAMFVRPSCSSVRIFLGISASAKTHAVEIGRVCGLALYRCQNQMLFNPCHHTAYYQHKRLRTSALRWSIHTALNLFFKSIDLYSLTSTTLLCNFANDKDNLRE